MSDRKCCRRRGRGDSSARPREPDSATWGYIDGEGIGFPCFEQADTCGTLIAEFDEVVSAKFILRTHVEVDDVGIAQVLIPPLDVAPAVVGGGGKEGRGAIGPYDELHRRWTLAESKDGRGIAHRRLLGGSCGIFVELAATLGELDIDGVHTDATTNHELRHGMPGKTEAGIEVVVIAASN